MFLDEEKNIENQEEKEEKIEESNELNDLKEVESEENIEKDSNTLDKDYESQEVDNKVNNIADLQKDIVLEEGINSYELEIAPIRESEFIVARSMQAVNDYIEVNSFEELKKEINSAGNQPKKIKIMKSFELEETLTIGPKQNIILTANNKRPMGKMGRNHSAC